MLPTTNRSENDNNGHVGRVPAARFTAHPNGEAVVTTPAILTELERSTQGQSRLVCPVPGQEARRSASASSATSRPRLQGVDGVTENREPGTEARSPADSYVPQVTEPPGAQPSELLTVPYVCAVCGEIFFGGEHWHPVCRPCWERRRRG
jgi:hypothetical protein